jgi:hypothetical protein
VQRRQPPPAAPQRVEAGVGDDPVEPRPGVGAGLEAVAPPPRAQERLLHRVLGLLEGPEHPVAVHVQLAPVALHQRRERRLVAGGGGRDDLVVVGGAGVVPLVVLPAGMVALRSGGGVVLVDRVDRPAVGGPR